MTRHIRKAKRFVRGRRFLTAAILAIAVAGVAGATSGLGAGGTATVNGDATCGYTGTTQFTESTVMRWAQVNGTGLAATFSAYANDENSMLLGVNGATPNTASPDYKAPGNGGAAAQSDGLGRPYYPALYITPVNDIGNWTKPGDQTPQELGDWQQGGTPRNLWSGSTSVLPTGTPYVDDVFGTWVTGSVVTPIAAPRALGTLGVTLTQNVNYGAGTYSLAVSSLQSQVFVNDKIVITEGANTQTLTAAATANAGDSSVTVKAFKAAKTFHSGVAAVTDGTAQAGGYVRQATLPAKNGWNLGTTYDAPVGQTFAAMGDEGYGTEFRWNIDELTDYLGNKLTTGQWYKIQVIEHDGDQNKTGGDSGEFCTLIKIPGPPSIKTDPAGGTDITGPSVDGHLKQWLGTQIKDTAFLSATAGFGNVTGSVEFKLYYQANPQPDPATVCVNPTDAPPGTVVMDKTVQLDGNDPSVATSPTYDTSQKGLGTYYWQDTFTPSGSNAGSYTALTEACGSETNQMVDARVRLTPHSAINIVGADHVLKAFVETTTDGSTWTPVSGAHVTTSLSPSGTSTVYVPAGTSACDTAVQTNPAGTYCTVTITDSKTETVYINASSTFTASGVSGGVNGNDSITRSTDNSASCSSDNATGATCEAIKHWINPKTTLQVQDQLIGLGADASGSVTYTYWINDSACIAGNGHDATPTSNTFDLGASPAVPVPFSTTITVNPGMTVYMQAHYEGNEGTVTTACTAETASSS